MLTLFKNIKFSLKINLSNFGNDRHMRHNKPQIDHVNVNFCWCYWGSCIALRDYYMMIAPKILL